MENIQMAITLPRDYERRLVATRSIIKDAGEDFYRKHHNRRSGRSTARMLSIMSTAITRPGEWIHVQDHEGGSERYLWWQLRDAAKALGLQLDFKRDDRDHFVCAPRVGFLTLEEAKAEGLIK